MRKEVRLRGRKEFAAVWQTGRRWANPLLILRARPNDGDRNRYGFVIGRRLGKAVVRNKVRRRLREGIHSLPTQPGWDIVISARVLAAQADYHELKRAVASLLARASLLAADQTERGGDNR